MFRSVLPMPPPPDVACVCPAVRVPAATVAFALGSRANNRRYQGTLTTGAAATSGLPQKRQKWRVGSLGLPQYEQRTSPGFATTGVGGGVTGRGATVRGT